MSSKKNKKTVPTRVIIGCDFEGKKPLMSEVIAKIKINKAKAGKR